MTHILNIIVLIFVIGFILSGDLYSQNEFKDGVKFYKQGANDKAIKALKEASKKEKNNAEMWNYLGLAYVKKRELGKAKKAFKKTLKLKPSSSEYHTNLAFVCFLENKFKEARKLLEKAIKLNPKNLSAFYFRGYSYLKEREYDKAIIDAEKAILLNKSFTSAYILKAKAHLYDFGLRMADEFEKHKKEKFTKEYLDVIKSSLDTLKHCLVVCQKADRDEIKYRLTSLTSLHEYYKRRIEKPIEELKQNNPKEWRDLKILTKPRPSYTSSARGKNIQGTILLAVWFTADKKIREISLIRGLKSGLTQATINAAKLITFEPPMRKGKPVPTVRIIPYNYTIY